MDQSKIWDYFQNNHVMQDAFAGAFPRYEFIAKKISSGMKVLNIGVGRGGLEDILIRKGVEVSCLDPSEVSIANIRLMHKLGDRARVGYSQSIPFPNNEFDVVVMSEVLEHLPDEILESTLCEVWRVIKFDGRFISTVPAHENLLDGHTVCPNCEETIFHLRKSTGYPSFIKVVIIKLCQILIYDVRTNR